MGTERPLRPEPASAGQRESGLGAPSSPEMDADEFSFRELVQNANTIVLRWDLQGCITFLHDFGLELFGYTAEQLLGRSVIGTIVPATDTTARRRAEQATRDRERRYQVLFRSTPIPLIERDVSALKTHIDGLRAAGVADLDAYLRHNPEALAACLRLVKVTDLNAAAMELYDTRDPAALESFGHVDDRERFADLVRALIAMLAAGRIGSEEREATIHTFSGGQRRVLTRSTVVPGSESGGARVITALIDVTEQRQAVEALRASEEQFRFLAVHDTLTGLYNTRYLYEHLPELLSGSDSPCAVVFMDLDRFKD